MNRMLIAAASAVALMGVAACSDNTTDDVVQAPAPGAQPQPVTENRAEVATTRAAVAFGMTRGELEDADLLSRDNTELGEVESLVLDAGGQLTHVVVELAGPGDIKAMVPVAQVGSITRNNGADKDLATDLTAVQLQALPRRDPNAAR